MRQGEELNPQLVDDVLKRVVPGLKGAPVIQQYASGASNLTYLISFANRELVFKRRI